MAKRKRRPAAPKVKRKRRKAETVSLRDFEVIQSEAFKLHKELMETRRVLQATRDREDSLRPVYEKLLEESQKQHQLAYSYQGEAEKAQRELFETKKKHDEEAAAMRANLSLMHRDISEKKAEIARLRRQPQPEPWPPVVADPPRTNRRKVDIKNMAATKDELSKLSREELEAAVTYWEPHAIKLRGRITELETELTKWKRMGLRRRLRWLLGARKP